MVIYFHDNLFTEKLIEYKYVQNDNFEDFASGRVIYHMGGEPTFPVRLAL